jgi:hypothetical protein
MTVKQRELQSVMLLTTLLFWLLVDSIECCYTVQLEILLLQHLNSLNSNLRFIYNPDHISLHAKIQRMTSVIPSKNSFLGAFPYLCFISVYFYNSNSSINL